MREEIKYSCSKCKKELTPEQIPCPYCGSIERTIRSITLETIMVNEKTKSKLKNNENFLKKEIKTQNTLSKESKRPARKYLEIDRTDPNHTMKKHKVDELSENGEWRKVHEENREYPSKRRPKKENE